MQSQAEFASSPGDNSESFCSIASALSGERSFPPTLQGKYNIDTYHSDMMGCRMEESTLNLSSEKKVDD